MNVAVITLGCDKNRVDAEHMLYRISCGGYGICDYSTADVIVINTCAFIESARQESIDTILECAALKKSGTCKAIVVTGCLSQKYKAELEAALPEADVFLPLDRSADICAAIESAVKGQTQEPEKNYDFNAAENCGRLITTYPHTAYIKIADGCDNHCTFCTIPSIRGLYRSRPMQDVVNEAVSLCNDGAIELILVAQDVTAYGKDLYGDYKLVELLEQLENSVTAKIRLLYCYPEKVTDKLIDKIAHSNRICKYIDIPLQHAADGVLKRMGRKSSGEQAERLIEKLHQNGIVVRTTLMVGFPGETETDFDTLCKFVARAKPEYAGIFAYSKERDTPSYKLDGHLTKRVKLSRVNALGKICKNVTAAFNASIVGKVINVVYEDVDYDKNLFVARSEFQAPDVDGRVYLTAQNPIHVGKVYQALITDSDAYDLYGRVINEST